MQINSFRSLQTKLSNKPALSRALPFLLFMAFIGLEELGRALRNWQVISFDDVDLYWLYPPKAILTGLVLIFLWRQYSEVNWRELFSGVHTSISCLCGVVVFLLWINMNWAFGTTAAPQGFDPGLFEDNGIRWLMIACRVAGAVLVVPVMEEIFWRSFLLRYIIASDFTKVPIGQFTIVSFTVVVALFGMEHNYFLAGMMAGAFFNILLYYTKSIAQCILSHAVANLCLAYYVLTTGYWHFW
jgi:CAAX prenyl protease-like protein